METNEQLRQRLISGASIHRVAERLIAAKRGTSVLWKTHVAATLVLLYKIPLRDAKAVVAEMALDN